MMCNSRLISEKKKKKADTKARSCMQESDQTPVVKILSSASSLTREWKEGHVGPCFLCARQRHKVLSKLTISAKTVPALKGS